MQSSATRTFSECFGSVEKDSNLLCVCWFIPFRSAAVKALFFAWFSFAGRLWNEQCVMPKNAFRILNFALPCRILLFPPTGCSRAHTRTHTAECAFCTVFYSVFCFSTMLPWGGEGGAGTTDVTDGTEGDVSVPCNLAHVVDATPRWGGGMLTFHVTCSRCWCYATLGWGGC